MIALTEWILGGDRSCGFERFRLPFFVNCFHPKFVIMAWNEAIDFHFRHCASGFSNGQPNSSFWIELLNNVVLDWLTSIIFRSLPFEGASIFVYVGDFKGSFWLTGFR